MIDDFLLKIKNRKLVVVLAPILGGLFLGGLMVLRPALSKMTLLKTEKAGLSQKAAVFSAMAAQEKQVSDYRKRLSRTLDQAKFIEDLNTLAANSGLSVLSMVPDDKKVTAVYLEKVGIRIEAEGNYHQLGDFVSRVESLDQFAKISAVDINTEARLDDNGGPPQDTASARVPTPKSGGAYKISILVGLFYPAQGVF